jgi:hypothetical protein
MTGSPTIVATIGGSDALHDALRARAEVVNVSRLELDRHAGFTGGYAAKVLSPNPAKRLSVESACALAAALGLDVVLIENAEGLARVTSRSPPREASRAKHAGTVQMIFSMKHIRQIARKGGQNSRAYLPRREATRLAKKAARARWDKVKA